MRSQVTGIEIPGVVWRRDPQGPQLPLVLDSPHSGSQYPDDFAYRCPLPVLRTRKALAGLAAGSLLEVHATDPAAVKDMAAFCEATGHVLVESSAGAGIYRFLLRKAG